MRRFEKEGISYTPYDTKSIMHYSLPAWMYISRYDSKCFIKKNLKLSRGDKKMMLDVYPKSESQYKSERQNLVNTFEQIISNDSLIDSNNYFANKAEYFSKEVSENSKYIIGLQGLKIPEDKYSELSNFFKNEDYIINLNTNYDTNRSWLASKPTVLYYSKKNKKKAMKIAQDIKRLTGNHFSIARGRGLMVFDKEKQFYIHWIK